MKDIQVVTPNAYNYLHSTSTDLSIPVTGLNKLVQEIVLHLKRTPNRDLSDPDIGAALRSSLPLSTGRKTEKQVYASIVSSIMKVKEDIKDSQQNQNLKPTEKLENIEVLEATFSPTQTAWFINLKVTAQSKDETEFITLI